MKNFEIDLVVGKFGGVEKLVINGKVEIDEKNHGTVTESDALAIIESYLILGYRLDREKQKLELSVDAEEPALTKSDLFYLGASCWPL